MKFKIDKGVIPRFLIVMSSTLTIGFFLHHYLLSSILAIPEISWAIRGYAINGGLATAIFLGLLLFGKKGINNLGYIFVFASTIKLIFFFIVFRPHFNIDDVITKPEFFSFFIPYLLALVVEVFFLVQVLNAIPVDKTKYITLKEAEDESKTKETEEKDDLHQKEE